MTRSMERMILILLLNSILRSIEEGEYDRAMNILRESVTALEED